MQVDYKKLWIRLIEKGIKNKTDLIHPEPCAKSGKR